MKPKVRVVVPGYYLVCYNAVSPALTNDEVVVPGYYLVCYNHIVVNKIRGEVVVPGYYLVCYNRERKILHNPNDYAGF